MIKPLNPCFTCNLHGVANPLLMSRIVRPTTPCFSARKLRYPCKGSRGSQSNAYHIFPRGFGSPRQPHGPSVYNPYSPCALHARFKTTHRLSGAGAPYSTGRTAPGEPRVHSVFESGTGTWQYVVADPVSSTAVIIDPVLDYDPITQVIATQSADSLLSIVNENGYFVDKILETHAHADHLTAAAYLQKRLGEAQNHRPDVGIGKRITQVQELFGKKYTVPETEYEVVFDKLFDDDETFNIGGLEATAIHLPGHTPDHLGYRIGDNVFCGDSIFHVDIGTARCDFPGGSAKTLFSSGRKLLGLPDHVKIWTGHDYPSNQRPTAVPFMTVKDHKILNQHLKDGITEAEFVAQRKERDAKLGEPKLLHQSLQINIRGGKLPSPTELGQRMLHLPLKVKWFSSN